MSTKLAAAGIALPDETDASNILEHLEVALTVLASAQAAQTQPSEPPAEPPPAPEEAPMPGMMMSTIRGNPALSRFFDDQCKGQKKRWIQRIESLKARGLKVSIANKLTAAATSANLSLLPSGELSKPELVRQLDLIDELLPPSDDPSQLLSTARPFPIPTEEAAARNGAELDKETGLYLTPAQKKEIKERTARVSGKA